jgi:TonB family protein
VEEIKRRFEMKRGLKIFKKMRKVKEFRGVYKWALMISITLHVLVVIAVALPKGYEKVDTHNDKHDVKIEIVKYSELPPPPSITPLNTIPSGLSGDENIGEIPMPVRDEEAERDTIPDILNNSNTLIGEGDTEIKVDTETDKHIEKPVFIPYEERPVLVKEVKPEYPAIGREAGTEGTVQLMVYVGADGKVKNVVVTQPMEINAFNREAVSAAYKCEFTPATMSGNPIGVWIALPMKFKLH